MSWLNLSLIDLFWLHIDTLQTTNWSWVRFASYCGVWRYIKPENRQLQDTLYTSPRHFLDTLQTHHILTKYRICRFFLSGTIFVFVVAVVVGAKQSQLVLESTKVELCLQVWVDAFQTPTRHPQYTFQSPNRDPSDTHQTSLRHPSDTHQISEM